MKVSKSLLQAIVVAVAVGATVSVTSCTKEKAGVNPENSEIKKQNTYDCPGCGMG